MTNQLVSVLDQLKGLLEKSLPATITKQEVARMIGVTTRSVDRYVKAGLLPQPTRLTKRTVRWNRPEVVACLERLSSVAEVA